jgi:hypothetical protein
MEVPSHEEEREVIASSPCELCGCSNWYINAYMPVELGEAIISGPFDISEVWETRLECVNCGHKIVTFDVE